MSTNPPTTPTTSATASRPNPANPPIHRFSTVIYPSVSVLRSETGSDVLEGLHYGRLGSPSARALEAQLTARFSAYGCVLAVSRHAALVAATTAWLRAGDSVAVPYRIRGEDHPVFNGLLRKLGVAVHTYSTLEELKNLVREKKPKVVLVQAPIPPLFNLKLSLKEIPSIRAICDGGTVFVLDNIGNVLSTSETLSAPDGIDMVLLSADRSGGLLDCSSSIQLGVLLCANERSYRKIRAAIRGRLGPTAAAPNADDCAKAVDALRTADARRQVQEMIVQKVVAELQGGQISGVKRCTTYPGSLDVGIVVNDSDSFFDRLRLFQIGDGIGGGHSTSFAWPCWRQPADTGHSHWNVLSIGFEKADDIVRDLRESASPG